MQEMGLAREEEEAVKAGGVGPRLGQASCSILDQSQAVLTRWGWAWTRAAAGDLLGG